MSEPLSLTVVILTFNEAVHIERCIASLAGVAGRIVVVDSGSTDDTRERAAALGADVLENAWSNHARQLNWTLENAGIDSDWTMRIDADEVALPGLETALRAFIAAPGEALGASVNRRIHFLGRWMRWGGLYPIRTLRLWRTGRGRCEDRWMDEHIAIEGLVVHLDADIADINLHPIGWWIGKHNGYASREALSTLLAGTSGWGPDHNQLDRRARRKRWLKLRVYYRLPPGMRAVLYFAYRYFLRLGLLDGWPGLVFHLMQGLWYRLLVDVKLDELRRLGRSEAGQLTDALDAETALIAQSAARD